MNENQYVFGMIGLGTMGRNLLLNLVDHGFSVSGYDRDAKQVDLLNTLADESVLKGFHEIKDFVKSVKSPRTIMMLVPAGKIVDDVITGLLEILDQGDIIIDGGNSHFTDTDRRAADLESKGLHFFGMGISGGEDGARHGPSMMPGGDQQAYQHVKATLEAISAQVNGEPCVTYLGPGAAGHYVKMVHNGIEYALMQLIAETYLLLKSKLKLDNDAIQKVFQKWNEGRLQSFLLDITKDIFAFKKPGTDDLLLDSIKDEAKSKGTGKWTSQDAMDLQVPIPVIDAAVSFRDLSKYKSLRTQLSKIYSDNQSTKEASVDTNQMLVKLEEAFYFCMVTTYAQGMHLLFKASQNYNYNLQLDQIAKIWRGGCIIRSVFLEDIYAAYQRNSSLEHLLADEIIQASIKKSLPSTREIVSGAISSGFAVPAFSASLSYFESIRSENLPSNLIQAQRDFFGAHTYELIGKEGVFHNDWEGELK